MERHEQVRKYFLTRPLKTLCNSNNNINNNKNSNQSDNADKAETQTYFPS